MYAVSGFFSYIQYVTYVTWHENQGSVFENSIYINTSATLHASQSNSFTDIVAKKSRYTRLWGYYILIF